eukprot:10820131-Heterocapsa_arctica.AAC.1
MVEYCNICECAYWKKGYSFNGRCTVCDNAILRNICWSKALHTDWINNGNEDLPIPTDDVYRASAKEMCDQVVEKGSTAEKAAIAEIFKAQKSRGGLIGPPSTLPASSSGLHIRGSAGQHLRSATQAEDPITKVESATVQWLAQWSSYVLKFGAFLLKMGDTEVGACYQTEKQVITTNWAKCQESTTAKSFSGKDQTKYCFGCFNSVLKDRNWTLCHCVKCNIQRMVSPPVNSTEFVDKIGKPFGADEDIRRAFLWRYAFYSDGTKIKLDTNYPQFTPEGTE